MAVQTATVRVNIEQQGNARQAMQDFSRGVKTARDDYKALQQDMSRGLPQQKADIPMTARTAPRPDLGVPGMTRIEQQLARPIRPDQLPAPLARQETRPLSRLSLIHI